MAKQWEGWGASRQHGSPPAYAPAALRKGTIRDSISSYELENSKTNLFLFFCLSKIQFF